MFSNENNVNRLLSAAGKLKEVKRSGWIKKAGILAPESVADHSYRMALLGILLGEELKLDSAKIVRMCLLHDLAESVIGDLMPEEKKSKNVHREEELNILEKLLAPLPLRSRKLLLDDARELMAMKTDESRLTWEIDKLEMGLQARDYAKSGQELELLESFNPRKDLSDPAKQILDLYAFD